MFQRINRYTPEMFVTDRHGELTDKQRAYAAKIAAMKGEELTQKGNTLMFTLWSKKNLGGYSFTEYVFSPATWHTCSMSANSNTPKITRYAYV